MKTIIFHYRGMVERGANYTWTDGYSQNGPNGSILYPWSTRKECRQEAKQLGTKAVFYRNGKEE